MLSRSLAVAGLAGGLAAVALVACSDGVTGPPSSGHHAVDKPVVTDAIGGQTEVIVLRGTRGRSLTYIVRDGFIAISNGSGGTARAHRATSSQLAFLRDVGARAKRVDALERALRPVWKAMGLPDVDDPDAASWGAAGTAHRRRSSGPTMTNRPPASADTALTKQVDDDACTRLFLALYEDDQEWHEDVQTLNGLEQLADHWGCLSPSDDPSSPGISPACGITLADVLVMQAEVNWDYAVLEDDANSLEVMGCSPSEV